MYHWWISYQKHLASSFVSWQRCDCSNISECQQVQGEHKSLTDTVLHPSSLTLHTMQKSTLKPASHRPIIKESEGTQSVVQSNGICSDWFGQIVPIPLPDYRAKFLSDSENSTPCETTGDHLRLLFFPNVSFRKIGYNQIHLNFIYLSIKP